MDRVNNGTGLSKTHSLSNTVGAADPASVDKPNFSAIFFTFLSKHLSILERMEWKEGFTETGGESGNWLSHTHLSAGDL